MKKKRNKKRIRTSVICILIVASMLLTTIGSLIFSVVNANAAQRAIIYLSENKQEYNIGDRLEIGVRVPEGAESFTFTMGYNSSCMKITEGEYPENKVSVTGNIIYIPFEITGNGRMYFKAYDIVTNTGQAYGTESILRSAGTGIDPAVSECLLSSLAVDGAELTPAFDKYVDIYWVDLPENIADSVKITAVPENGEDTVSIEGNEGMVNGLNTIHIAVTTNGNSKTYTILANSKKVEEQQQEPEKEEDVSAVPEENEQSDESKDTVTFLDRLNLSFGKTLGIFGSCFLILMLIIMNMVRKNRKAYSLTDDAYREQEEKERKKRIEARMREKGKLEKKEKRKSKK